MSLNRATVLGNLGADPKVTIFDNNEKLVTLSLATNSTWIDRQTGEKREATEWHIVQLRRGLAGVADKYLKKGDKLYVTGNLKTRKYVNEKGDSQSITEIHGRKLQMISAHKSQSRVLEEKAKVFDVGMDSPSETDQKPEDSTETESAEIVVIKESQQDDGLNKQLDVDIEKPIINDGNSSDKDASLESPVKISDEVELNKFIDVNSAKQAGFHNNMQFASNAIDLLADEFNREAFEAQERDGFLDTDEDLPDWLLP